MSKQPFINRRIFLKRATAFGVGAAALAAGWPQHLLAQSSSAGAGTEFNYIQDMENPTPIEAAHVINMRLPIIAEDGANVPIIISMDHPMEDDHYIKSLQIFNFNDPVVSKGIFHMTPANGQAYFSTQLRLDGGDIQLFVVAECSQHGKWVGEDTLKVSLGGC
ncbi:MAG: thiosulfate oxidation carrier protein SoxY [Chloroflexota bacterium]